MKKLLLLALLLCAREVHGQTNGALAPDIYPVFTNTNGITPVANGFICTTASGTASNWLDTFQNAALTIPNQNPVRLNQSGRAVNGTTLVPIFMQATVYRFTLYAAAPYTGTKCNGTNVGPLVWQMDSVYDFGQLFAAGLTTITQLTLVETSGTATLGTELNTAPAAWATGSNVTNDGGGVYGFTAAAGPLSASITGFTAGLHYLISWTIGANPADTCGHLTVSIGAVSAGPYLWSCSDTGVFPRIADIVPAASGALTVTFTPDTDFHGHLSVISIKVITPMTSVLKIIDPTQTAVEVRASSGYSTTGMGLNSLQNNAGTQPTGDFGHPGQDNSAFGKNALALNSGGYWNAADGTGCLANNTAGFYNTCLGTNALNQSTLGFRNTSVGVLSGFSCTLCYLNTFMGDEAGFAVTTGTNNVYIGPSAGQDSPGGSFNTAVGVAALNLAVAGNFNTCIGASACQNQTGGADDTFIGTGAGQGALAGGAVPMTNVLNRDVAVGENAGFFLVSASGTTAVDNTCIGYYACNDFLDVANTNKHIVADTSMTLLGSDATKNTASTLDNGTAIGYHSFVTKSNEVVLGNSAVSEWDLGTRFTMAPDSSVLLSSGGLAVTNAATTSYTYVAVRPPSPSTESGFRMYNANSATVTGWTNLRTTGTTFVIEGSSAGGGSAVNLVEVAPNLKFDGTISSGSTPGITHTVTVKGSAGSNCDLNFVNGLFTSTTCP